MICLSDASSKREGRDGTDNEGERSFCCLLYVAYVTFSIEHPRTASHLASPLDASMAFSSQQRS
eukprot:CAMPEP_0115881886 /NCGR_PEP_ID=MMETSP0287-20121206/28695_1 /TAXON_ID=412157 /ORGANISM="Chrysochromulina rotalis, Strain UIO044" /LENGTH=63 /DNA_ID=CAMNT_0003337897 /DNA_START=44 /DNA_END=231 /DNA_ORIENTATION=+